MLQYTPTNNQRDSVSSTATAASVAHSFSSTSTTIPLSFDHFFLTTESPRDSFALPIDSADIQIAFGVESESATLTQSFPVSAHPDSAFALSGLPWSDNVGLKSVRNPFPQNAIPSHHQQHHHVYSSSPRTSGAWAVSSRVASFVSNAPSSGSSDSLLTPQPSPPPAYAKPRRPLPNIPPAQSITLPPPIDVTVQAPPLPQKRGFRALPRSTSSSPTDEGRPTLAQRKAALPNLWTPLSPGPTASEFPVERGREREPRGVEERPVLERNMSVVTPLEQVLIPEDAIDLGPWLGESIVLERERRAEREMEKEKVHVRVQEITIEAEAGSDDAHDELPAAAVDEVNGKDGECPAS
jgi:hypothetical protein